MDDLPTTMDDGRGCWAMCIGARQGSLACGRCAPHVGWGRVVYERMAAAERHRAQGGRSAAMDVGRTASGRCAATLIVNCFWLLDAPQRIV